MSAAEQMDMALEAGSGGGGKGKKPKLTATSGGGGGGERQINLADEARRRYLNYALSVITSRALPDVRDGLKPVQRRILFGMWNENVTADAKYRKCANVVGTVMGQFHPHGDSSIYDAMVRLAQDFSLRYPLVDGHGNFGSQDGDSPAAYRYTECRLRHSAIELLDELKQRTVAWRPTFDGVRSEPIVLPARLPNLLINGSQGIAVGMATDVPPHNLGEVVDACLAMIDAPGRTLDTAAVLKFVRGPDFPTGGELICSKQELREVYETGSGSLRLRGQYKLEEQKDRRGAPTIVITSIPYALTRASIMEKIGEIINEKKVPQLVDCRDESTTDVRMVLELKKGADPQMVMAYLFKHTNLQSYVKVNLTCLVPTDNPEVGAPQRLSLAECIRHFIVYRFETVTRRLQFELDELNRRIHSLEGLEKIYDALDEVLRIIRASEGKADAAAKLMKRFGLDEEQVDAILELKLYRLARLEILVIQKELGERRRDQKRLEALLASDEKRWGVVARELGEAREKFADKRRTRIGVLAEEPSFDPDAFIVAEDATVVLTRDGWVKRVGQLKDVSTTRVREGDEVLTVLAGSTKESVAFFTSHGSAYVCKIVDIPPSTGYGDPVQKLFKFDDGERVVAALSLDPRLRPNLEVAPNLLAVTRGGMGLRIGLAPHLEPSKTTGRSFAKLHEGDEVIGVRPAPEDAIVTVASKDGHALTCLVSEIAVLSGPGKGVHIIKLEPGDQVLGFSVNEPLQAESDKGKVYVLGASKNEVGSRGGKGRELFKRGQLVKLIVAPPTIPVLKEGQASQAPRGPRTPETDE